MKAKLLILMLGLFPLLAISQNYEMRGDSCFNIGDYQKSVKQYNAAIELSGESTSLINKRDIASDCCSLLRQALEAENNLDAIDACQCYTRLYELHSLPEYKDKADQYHLEVIRQENFAQQKALAQSYEQEGDDYFSEGNYKMALGKYKAAVAAYSTEELIQKRDKASNCNLLLTKAKEAKNEEKYSNASQLYKQLYELHPLFEYDNQTRSLLSVSEYEQYGDSYYAKGEYQTAISKYDSAIKIIGETDVLSRKRTKASSCFSLLTKAQKAANSSSYANAYKYYNQLYNEHSLSKYKERAEDNRIKNEKIKNENASKQSSQQNTQYQNQSYYYGSALMQQERQKVIKRIEAVHNTFPAHLLIKHPLGIQYIDWRDTKISQRRKIEDLYPGFKNSPQRSHFKLESKISGVVIYAPLTYASFHYTDKENGYYIHRTIDIVYKIECESKIYAEEVVKKLQTDLRGYTYRSISSDGNVVTISSQIKNQVKNPLW